MLRSSGNRREATLHQFAAQDRHGVADQDNARTLDADLDHSAPARDLVGYQVTFDRASRPNRGPDSSVPSRTPGPRRCPPGARRNGKQNRIMRARTAGDNHAADRELLQAANIRTEVSNQFFGLELDQKIEPIATGKLDWSPQRRPQLGELASVCDLLMDWLGGKIQLDPAGAASERSRGRCASRRGRAHRPEGGLPPRERGRSPEWRDRIGRLLSWA